MFVPKKVDPLVGIATSVMKEGDLRRGAEKLTNETLGVFSRRELPHERYAEYDALLVQNVDQALGKAKTLTESIGYTLPPLDKDDDDDPNDKRDDTPNQAVAKRSGVWVDKDEKTPLGNRTFSAPVDSATGRGLKNMGGTVTVNENRQQTLERFIREQKKYSKKDVDENFESIKRAKANWDKANKGTKAEKQKNEILGWHDKSHKKQDSDETKTK